MHYGGNKYLTLHDFHYASIASFSQIRTKVIFHRSANCMRVLLQKRDNRKIAYYNETCIKKIIGGPETISLPVYIYPVHQT